MLIKNVYDNIIGVICLIHKPQRLETAPLICTIIINITLSRRLPYHIIKLCKRNYIIIICGNYNGKRKIQIIK